MVVLSQAFLLFRTENLIENEDKAFGRGASNTVTLDSSLLRPVGPQELHPHGLHDYTISRE